MGQSTEPRKNILAEVDELEEQEEQKAPPKKKNKKKPFVFSAAFFLFLVAVGTAYYFYGDIVFGSINKEPKKEPVVQQWVSLDPFVVNLMDSYSPLKYLKVVIQIETNNQNLIEVKKPNLRDAIIFVLTRKTAEELITQEGKLYLKDEIKEAVNKTVGENIISSVYFTEFVLQ